MAPSGVRQLWFQRLGTLEPGLDLSAVARRFATVVRDVATSRVRKRPSIAGQFQHGVSGVLRTIPSAPAATPRVG